MRYFSGTLSRDGHTLGDVLGEIRLEQTYLDTMSREEALRWGREGVPSVSQYKGSMDAVGWKPGRNVLGTTLRLTAIQGFALDVVLSDVSVHPSGGIIPEVIPLDDGEPLLQFVSVGPPIVMPTARAPVPAHVR